MQQCSITPVATLRMQSQPSAVGQAVVAPDPAGAGCDAPYPMRGVVPGPVASGAARAPLHCRMYSSSADPALHRKTGSICRNSHAHAIMAAGLQACDATHDQARFKLRNCSHAANN